MVVPIAFFFRVNFSCVLELSHISKALTRVKTFRSRLNLYQISLGHQKHKYEDFGVECLIWCVWFTEPWTFDQTWYWVFLWEHFKMQLTFKSTGQVKQIVLFNVNGPHPNSGRPEYTNLALLLVRGNFSCPKTFKPRHCFFLLSDSKWNLCAFYVSHPPAFGLMTPLAFLGLQLASCSK